MSPSPAWPGPFTERIGAKPVLLAGLATFTAGIGWLSRVPLHGTFLADLLGPTLIIGVGLALSSVALTIASTSGVPADRSGVAAGLINMTQQVGGAVGLAVLAAVASSQLHGSASHVAINNGFRAALLVATGLAAATILAAVALPGRHDRSGLGHAVPVLAPAAVPSA